MLRPPLLAILPLALLLLPGCRTQPAQAQVLGRPPASGAVTDIGRLSPSPTPVTVRGTIIEKCPVAGCWFKIKDRSGVLKVSTRNAGFVVLDVPEGAELTVSGTLPSGPVREMDASGLSY